MSKNLAMDFMGESGIKVKVDIKSQEELNSWLGMSPINESILDAEKKELNPEIWKNEKLKKDIVDQLMNIIKKVLKESNVEESRLTAAFLEGSNLTYYYTKYSDIDAHMYIEDITEEEKESVDSHVYDFNKETVFVAGTKNNIELYLMDDKQKDRTNGPRYDLIQDKWIKPPTRIKMPAEMYKAAVEISMTFARDLDLAFGEIKRDVIEYMVLTKELEDVLNIDIKQLADTRTMKIEGLKADLEALVLKEENIKAMRRKAFTEDYIPKDETLYHIPIGEGDRSYTLLNMIFKILQRFNYVDSMKKLKYDVYNKAIESKDFDTNIDFYIKRITEVLKFFGKIDE
jgi:predicted nucleotidyltransferase